MNNDIYLIDQFIKSFAHSASIHDNFSAEKWDSTIYYYLVRQGVSNYDINMDLDKSGMFARWQRYYKNKENCSCFVDENWKYFCQFVNRPKEVLMDVEQIKIYIPLDYNHIEIGAEAIFDYLEKNNIAHISKVGKNIRFDDIVVRLVNENDAKKLQDFINKNQYIQEGLIKANPFSFSKDRIAYACDGRLSYNSTVSNIIAKYLEELKANNLLNQASAENFIFYWASRYKVALEDDFEFSNFISDVSLNEFSSSNVEVARNYMKVMELLIDNLLTKYIDNLKQSRDNLDANRMYYDNKIVNIVNEYGRIFSLNVDIFEQFNKNNKEGNMLKECVDMALVERYNKYESYYSEQKSNVNGQQAVKMVISDFVKTGNYKMFTRENGIRSSMIRNVSQKDLIKVICNQLGLSVPKNELSDDEIEFISEEYCQNLIQSYNLNQRVY